MDETHLNLAQLVHLALDVERRGAAAAGATADVGAQEVRREAVEHRAVLVDRDEHKATLLERAADDACVARVPRREAALGARPRGRPHRLDRTPRELRSLTAAAALGLLLGARCGRRLLLLFSYIIFVKTPFAES